ncbi:MAG: type III polyketide synthase [Bacteroidia bacterium]
MKQPSIQVIGTAVPQNKISQEIHYSILESANGLSRGEKLRLRKIYSNSGIASRYSVLAEFGERDNDTHILFHPANHHAPMPVSHRMQLYEEYATSLGVEATENCLKQLPGLKRNEITHLITYSCTGMFAPGIDIQLTEKLDLNRNVERTCINFMGCYAAINALKVADYIARSQAEAVVLVVGVELCTLHYQKNDLQDQVVANALFGDGAAACIVSSKTFSPEKKSLNLSLQNFYSEFEPAGKDEMVWRIGDFGFDLRLSAYVPQLIKESINQLMQKLFARANVKQSEIDFYAIHPGGIKILEACEQALHITHEQNQISYNILRDYGNMSSVTILFVLNEYLKTFSATDKGKKILACAFGPGLTMESMIVEVS